MLIELARAFARAPSGPPSELTPKHTIVFASTDGGAFGGLGAARLAASPTYRDRIVAVLNLDAVAGDTPARLELAGDEPRSPAAVLVETLAERLREQTGVEPGRTSGLGQLIDLAFPFSLYEQAPFVARGIPAVTITTAGSRPELAFDDRSTGLNGLRLTQIGRAAQLTLGSLDQSLDVGSGTSTYVYLGSRFVRGWAIELCLVAALLPFLIAAVDLFARCRRRGIPLRPAFRALRARAGYWLVVAGLFELLALLGAWPKGASRPPSPATEAAGTWPLFGLAVLVVLASGAWLLARRPLLPLRPSSAADELAGHTAALVSLGVLSLLVVATNPFALLFLLPSLHAWVWLPQVGERPVVRAAVLAAGFSGPALLLGSLAVRFELGLDAPWYAAELLALGYVPLTSLVLAVAWTAAAAQLVALGAGRYAPYPSGPDRPPRGPVRELVRQGILTILRLRARRRAPLDGTARPRGLR